MKKNFIIFCLFLIGLTLLNACRPAAGSGTLERSDLPGTGLQVLAVETFLADIAQNIAGDRLNIEVLVPAGLDPHSFEPVPQDLAKISDSQILIINGAGIEEWLDEILQNAGGERRVIEASAGLTSRKVGMQETGGKDSQNTQAGNEGNQTSPEVDPHFWLDPNLAIAYVENIREGLIEADPEGKETYTQNAVAYINQLGDLDAWIKTQVADIPPERRVLVTNHESFGYYADRYGFKIVGTILPSVNSLASPSPQQMATLVDEIRRTGAPAVFLETGSNPELAQGIARETGVKVVTGLYTHSLSDSDGEAPTYIDMMQYNTRKFVEALY